MTNSISRAGFLRLAAMSASLIVVPTLARADDNEITRDMILSDPDAPVAGNPNGDLTIVDFFDYNCPYCKKAATSLEKLVKADGNIRLVYRTGRSCTKPRSSARGWRWQPNTRTVICRSTMR